MAWDAENRKAAQDKFCRLIAEGLSIKKACAIDGTPPERTIFEWLYDDEEFSQQYARARERRADARAERIDDISERLDRGDLDHNQARVMIDAEKWQAGKENAKRYGDKLSLDGDFNIKLPDEQIESRLAFLIGKAGIAGSLGGTGAPEGETQVLQHVPGGGTASS